ncbi:MAG: efflux RND transporter permease subunit, partial [Pseudomonadota bacterium]
MPGGSGVVVGDFGNIFSQFSLVVAACLIFSMIESKLILPAHLRPLEGKNRAEKAGSYLVQLNQKIDKAFVTFRDRSFLPFLKLIIKHRYTSLLVIVTFWTIALGLINRDIVRSVFFPNIPVEVVYANIEMQPDASFGLTEDLLDRMETVAMQIGEDYQTEHSLASSPINAVQTRMTGDLTGFVAVSLELDGEKPLPPALFGDRLRAEIERAEGLSNLRVRDSEALPEGLFLEVRSNAL